MDWGLTSYFIISSFISFVVFSFACLKYVREDRKRNWEAFPDLFPDMFSVVLWFFFWPIMGFFLALYWTIVKWGTLIDKFLTEGKKDVPDSS